MIECRCGTGFGLEAAHPLEIGGEGWRENLERDEPIEPRVVGTIDLAHATSREPRDHLVVAETGAGVHRNAGIIEGARPGNWQNSRVPFLWFLKKVHWSDTDAAGIVWFPNFLGWYEDAEEELFAVVLGRTRQAILDELAYAMPRVESSAKYRSPVRAGQLVRIGLRSVIENPRRLRHEFEMREAIGDTLIAEGFVRVASVDLAAFTPRDFPAEVLELVAGLPAAIAQQQAVIARDGPAAPALPWV